MHFEPTPPGEPADAIDLELARLGAQTGPLNGPELDGDRAALARADALFAERRRPLKPRRTVYYVGGAVALAAVALFMALVGTPTDDGLRPMGGSDPLRALQVALLPGPEAQTFFVEITAPAPGWAEVATLQDDGTVSVLVSGDALPTTAGQTLRVEGLVRLDGFESREWLVVEHTTQPRTDRSFQSELPALLPDPTRHADADTFVVEVTRR